MRSSLFSPNSEDSTQRAKDSLGRVSPEDLTNRNVLKEIVDGLIE